MLIATCVEVALAQERPVAAVLRSSDREDLDVTSLAPSADGALLLAFGPEHAVVLGTDEGDRRAAVDRTGISHGAVAPTGRFALVHEGGLTLHGTDGREELRLGGFGRVTSIALSPDARWVAVGTTLSLALHDAMDGRLAWTKDGATAGVAFSPDGRAVLAERGGEAVAYDVGKGGEARGVAAAGTTPGFRPAGCAPEDGTCPVPGAPSFERGDRLVLVNDGAVERWRLLYAEQVGTLPLAGAPVAATWAGEDRLVGLSDGSVVRVGANGGTRLEAAAPGCAADCTFVALGGSAEETWTAGPGGLQRWDGGGMALVRKPKPLGALMLRRMGDGRWVTLDDDGRVRVGDDPGAGRPTPELPGAIGADAAGSTVVAWGPGGVVVAGADGGERTAPSLGPGRRPTVAALSPDGDRVALIDDQGALHVYRTADAGAVYRLPLHLPPDALAWSADGTRLLAGGPTLRVFGAEDGRELATVVLGEPVVGLAASSSGRWLVRSADGVRTLDAALLE